MPSLEALHNRYKDKGLKILAINTMETFSQASDFIEENEYTFHAILDEDGRVTMSYGVPAFPTIFIIDRNGMIAVRLIGGLDWDSPSVHTTIDNLLN